MPETYLVEWAADRCVTAIAYRAAAEPVATLVLAHGAGASQRSDFMVAFADALSSRELDVITFNFPFTEGVRKLPDPQPVLEACYRGVLDHLDRAGRLGSRAIFIGGKSLGGRISSHLAAAVAGEQDSPAGWIRRFRGLVLLGYPLHPPARPQQVRVSHLPAITHPMLFVQGERDPFGTPAELRAFADVLPAACDIYAVGQGDHSFAVLKRSGLDQAAVHAAAQDYIVAWIRARVESATSGGPPPSP